jgi:hypothetical protein
MVVAVVLVGVVQVARDEVVHVVAVRHGFVTATRRMFVVWLVPAAAVLRGAAVRVVGVDGDGVLVDVALVRMVQVAVVQVVHVAVVQDRHVPAAGAVLVRMVGVGGVFAHGTTMSSAGRFTKEVRARAIPDELGRVGS